MHNFTPLPRWTTIALAALAMSVALPIGAAWTQLSDSAHSPQALRTISERHRK